MMQSINLNSTESVSVKTKQQQETEAILRMAEKIELLERIVEEQKKRIRDLEDLLKNK